MQRISISSENKFRYAKSALCISLTIACRIFCRFYNALLILPQYPVRNLKQKTHEDYSNHIHSAFHIRKLRSADILESGMSVHGKREQLCQLQEHDFNKSHGELHA
jgi:hypothetical protein